MKKIYSIFLIAIASLFLAPAINAQTHTINDYIRQKYDNDTLTMRFPKDNGVIIDEDLKVAYSKNVSSPFSDGVYYIKLETFATGQASTKLVDAPADIVLVLDLSSSMVNNYTHTRLAEPKSESYIPTHGAGNRWRYGDLDDNSEIYEFHVEYEGAEYKVMKGQQRSGNTTYYFFYFEDSSGTRHYLDGNDIVDTYPRTLTNPSSSQFIYNKPLIRVRVVETRLEALQRATCAFIDVIEKKDKYSDEEGKVERVDESGKPKRLGNRISIITFWSQANLIVPLNEGALADVADDDHTTAAALKSLVMGFVNGKGTRQDFGIAAANNQLSSISDARKKEASSTVVVFTDGEPYNVDDPAGSSQDITPLYNNAIQNALLTKSEDNPKTSDVEGYGATVFTVGLFTSEPNPSSNLWKFMNYMSSNAPNASNLNTPGADFDQTADFYQDASGENADLEDVFTAIAKQSASGTTTLSVATSTVDVVSNSFILPPGVDATNIKNNVIIFTAPLTSIGTTTGGKKVYNFGTEIQQPYNNYQYDADGNPVTSGGTDIDAAIEVKLGGKDSIKVTNFDYSRNWCGPIVDETQTPPVTTYRGHKIIMLIPIKMNPDAVGGPNCETNEPGSGIYVDDQALQEGNSFIEFESPSVSLPVNMYLEKKGLTGVESVKFRIERALLPVGYGDWTSEQKAAFDPSTLTGWEYVTAVFVTNSTNSKHNPDTNNPWVKVRGLPANTTYEGVQRDYIYRVSEEPWSWSYKLVLPAGAALKDGVYYQYTDTKHIENPFLFENETIDERIDVKIRHAESKVTNHFSTDVTNTILYDDSKSNDR